MSYTNADVEASTKFSDYNTKVRLLQLMHKNAPHLVSHLNITVRDATEQDFYIPKTLKHASKIITVDFTEDLCKLLSCNPVKENTMCRPNEKASYYYVGDDSYDIQCQPSCFNTARKITYGDDGERAPDVPMLNWHNGKCRIVNTNMVSWLEKTFYRSDTKYETRVNDMPTGFSRVPSTVENGCGFTYKTNPSYCGYYDRTYKSDGSCGLEIWETILDAVIGMNVINTLKSSIRMLVNGNQPFAAPSNLPKLPDSVPKEYTLPGWRDSVNPNFKLPELLDTSPRAPTRRRKRDLNDNDDDDFDPSTLSDFMRRRMGLQRTVRVRETNPDDPANRDKTWLDKTLEILTSLLEMMTTADFWTSAAIDVTASFILERLKKTAANVATKLTAFLAKGGLKLGGRVGLKVLGTGIRGIFVRAVATTVVRIASKAAIMLSKILVAASSVIGWILVVTMFLDILFQFWDPYGYNNMFPPELPNDIMQGGELALRQALASVSADYTFDNLCGTLLSEDEMLTVQIESLIDRVTYLDSLVVNSEGTRLDKGDEVDADAEFTENRVTTAGNQIAAARVRFDVERFNEYNHRFDNRVILNKHLNYAASVSITVSIFFAIFTSFSLITILSFLISTVILCLSMFNLQNDSLLDLFEQYKNLTVQGAS